MNRDAIKQFGVCIGWTLVWSLVSMMSIIALLFICAGIGWLCAHYPQTIFLGILVVGSFMTCWFFMWRKYYYWPRQEKIWEERGWRPTDDPDWNMR